MVNENEQRLWRAKEGLENAVARIAQAHEVHPDYGDNKNERRRKAETEWVEAIVRRITSVKIVPIETSAFTGKAQEAVNTLVAQSIVQTLIDRVRAALADGRKMRKAELATTLNVKPEALDAILTVENGIASPGAGWWALAEKVNA